MQTHSERKQIYIVDDDESVCRALKLHMVAYGFNVETFLSAEEFFNAVPDNAPGCLILDIHMPGLNGWEVQQRLRKTGCGRHVIVITGDADINFREKALKAGAVGFLQKPFNDRELVDMVNLSCQ